ncbi:SprB repeat-containing protein, partial [Salinimicrobium flavum]
MTTMIWKTTLSFIAALFFAIGINAQTPDLRTCMDQNGTTRWNCPSNNFTLDDVYLTLVDVDGNVIDEKSCTSGVEQTAFVYLNYTSNANSPIYQTRVFGDLVIEGESQALNVYIGEVKPANQGSQTSQIHGPITWICGTELRLENILVVWKPSYDSKISENSYDCSSYGKSQCEFGTDTFIAAPLAVQFDYSICRSDGTTTVIYDSTTNGGKAPFTLNWDFTSDGIVDSNVDNPTYNTTSAANFSTTLEVIDAQGTTSSYVVNIDNPAEIELSADKYDVGCNEENNGSIDLNISGGTAEYSFSWIGPDTFSSNQEDLSGLSAGTYEVTVTDAFGCEKSLSVEIGELQTPATPVVDGSVTQPTCDVATGSFSITAVAGMEYSFDGGAFGTTTSWSELAANTYTVVAKNADGCVSSELSVTINDQPETPAAPVVAGEVSQPTCELATGSFSITAVDGMTYSFNGGAFGTTTSWSDLAADTYTVVAKNADGCVSSELSVTINAQPETPAAPVVDGSVTQPTCDVATGSFSITAVAGMEYSFDGGAFGTTTSWSELAADTYTVVARNADGCVSESLTVTINAQPETPAAPALAGEVTQPTCDVATGSFSITPVNGMEYSFDGGEFGTTTSWSGLAADTYTVTARNTDGCVSEALSVTINAQPATHDAPALAGEVTQPTCTVATGSFSITAVDGMTYSFNGGAFGTT